MADARRHARALTIMAPVTPGREPALRSVLEALPTGDASPLARLPGTHFARFVVVSGLGDSERLLFSANHDRLEGSYLEEIRARMPQEADAIWGHCDGYPGAGQSASFVRYMEGHRIRTDLLVAAYPDARLREVLQALDLRRWLIDFAPRAQSMSPEELQAAFREEGLGGAG
jgi:hypothetical protein